MKNRTLIIILIVILILVVLSLSSFMIDMLKGNRTFSKSIIMTDKILDEKYDQKFEKIAIDSDASLVEIRHSTDGDINLVIYGDEEKTHVQTDGRILSVKTSAKRFINLLFSIKVSKIILYLPKDYFSELEINNKYGDITVDDFADLNLSVEEDCGDIEIGKVHDLKLSSKYGNVDIDEVDKAELSASCGNIAIKTINDGRISADMGDIKIDEVLEHIDIKESCGNVKISSLVITKDSQITNSLGDIRIGKKNDIYIDAKTSLGDVKINENYRQSDITLKIKNSAGNIKIDN